MGRYRKRPVVIEALQFTGDNLDAIVDFSGYARDGGSDYTDALVIETLEGDMTARAGDWIIRGVQGELYPCRDDIFAATYEPVDAEDECP